MANGDEKKESNKDDDVIEISDVFLNMDLKEPAYIKNISNNPSAKDSPVPKKSKVEMLIKELNED